jgi:uncharacterized protein
VKRIVAMTKTSQTISVEVIYASLEQVFSVHVQLPVEKACVKDAIALARLSPQWPKVEIDSQKLAIFGQATQLNSVLHDGDRIEILRPLLIDPMDARRGRIK